MRSGWRRLVAVAMCVSAVSAVPAGAGTRPDPPAVVASVPSSLTALTLAELPLMNAVAALDPTATTLRRALVNSNRYILNVWWPRHMSWAGPIPAAAERLAAKHTLDDEELRRYSSVALTLAAPIATKTYSNSMTGVPAASALDHVAALVQILVRTHRANLGTDVGWGGSWQSALWSSQAGLAGWLAGDALPEPDRLMLARMLEYEADAVSARKMHYLRDRHGAVLTPGDSGAEELAWDALGEFTAVELLPHHPRRHAWAVDAYERFIAAYARPQDVTSSRKVHGRALSSWLGGSNVEPNGIVVNHGRVNPDYTVSMSMHAAAISGLVGNGVPRAVLTNQDKLHRALSSTPFTGRGYRRPGGTVYVPNSAAIYHPQGPDWGTHRQVVYGVFDLQIAAFGLDSMQRVPARTWAARHLGQVLAMQGRFKTGQTYAGLNEDKYFAREEWTGSLLAYAELVDWLSTTKRLRVDDRPASAKKPVP